MRSLQDLIKLAEEHGMGLHEIIMTVDSEATGVPTNEIYNLMLSRLKDMRRSTEEASRNPNPCKLVPNTGVLIREYSKGAGMCGGFLLKASAIALEVASYNASMGRIVAAPTAGSCGILPGMLFSWEEFYGKGMSDLDRKLTEALIVAGAVGEIIANRATLAGAEGGCQAECGAAAAMGSAALVYLQGGKCEAVSNAVALTLKSVLGLVCDPVGGLVESPCIKRNGILLAVGVLAADMALAGVVSLIPADEVIDAMGQIGKSMPASLRETSRGGLAVTPTAKRLSKELNL